jgi:sortase system peptidoglycan-associated protein
VNKLYCHISDTIDQQFACFDPEGRHLTRIKYATSIRNTKNLEKILMIKSISAILLVAALHSSVSSAAETVQNAEKIKKPASFAAPLGMLTGAAVAGPVGVLVATTLGIIFDAQSEKKYQLELALQSSSTLNKKQLIAYQQELSHLQDEQNERDARFLIASREWNESQQAGFEKSISYSLQFRTGSSEIEAHYVYQLDGLVHLLTTTPQLNVRLTGHSDQLGNEQYNQHLSRNRVEKIETYLVSAGIGTSRIQSYAYGESSPLNQQAGIEENPFERRVTIHVSPSRQAVVSN